MEKYIDALSGISYFEWIKLRESIDKAFKMQKGEFEKTLKLANGDTVKHAIRSQFGCKSD